MKAYIVVEGIIDAELLTLLLDKRVKAETQILVGGGKSSASSLARTLLVTRRKPVALVVDADTSTPQGIQEKRQSLEELLRLATSGVLFKVFLAVPQIETIFFNDETFLVNKLNVALSEEELITAKFLPRQILEQLFQKTSSQICDRKGLINSLTPDDIKKLGLHPLVNDINEFLLKVITMDEELHTEAA